MINFDVNGNIIPYEIIEVSLNIFQKKFTFNEHRGEIFEEYLAFCDTLKSIGVKNFYQLIDGSFITQKIFPKDIDVVTFVEADFFNNNAVKRLCCNGGLI